MMWLPPIGTLIKGMGKEIVIFLIIIIAAGIAVGAVFAVRGCISDTSQPDYLEDAKQEILDSVTREREKNDQRIEELEAEIYDLRIQVEDLDAEVAESATYREGIHDAIDLAITIDDIDRVLRGGIPGVSGR